MNGISAYELSRLQTDLTPVLRRTIEAVANVIERQEADGLIVRDRRSSEVWVGAGPLLVFFRAAFGLQRAAFVQYGHFVLGPDGRTRREVDGEWNLGHGSSYRYELHRERGGERLVGRALDHVLQSVAEKHEDVRLVDGAVQPGHTLVEQDERW